MYTLYHPVIHLAKQLSSNSWWLCHGSGSRVMIIWWGTRALTWLWHLFIGKKILEIWVDILSLRYTPINIGWCTLFYLSKIFFSFESNNDFYCFYSIAFYFDSYGLLCFSIWPFVILLYQFMWCFRWIISCQTMLVTSLDMDFWFICYYEEVGVSKFAIPLN